MHFLNYWFSWDVCVDNSVLVLLVVWFLYLFILLISSDAVLLLILLMCFHCRFCWCGFFSADWLIDLTVLPFLQLISCRFCNWSVAVFVSDKLPFLPLACCRVCCWYVVVFAVGVLLFLSVDMLPFLSASQTCNKSISQSARQSTCL